MLTQIKQLFYGAIAAVGLFFVVWFQYLRNKTAKQAEEIETLKSNAMAQDEINEAENAIQNVSSDSVSESDSDIDAWLLKHSTRNKG